MTFRFLMALSPLALLAASCGSPAAGDSTKPSAVEVKDQFKVEVLGTFDEPWAMVLLPGGKSALITERSGHLRWWIDDEKKSILEVTGVPKVAYGGQGGLGDIALAPDFEKSHVAYLSWVEAGPDGTRGAVLGRATFGNGTLVFVASLDIKVIWRQTPKVTGRGHFSHRIAFSPDGKYMFVSSGERQKFTPAQDLSNNLGKVLRLNLDGTPAAGNPFADKGGVSAQIWSYGHRNLLGLQFDASGQLWDLEHGPAGGDELNRIEPGKNYGWPLVSDGDNYDGSPIPRNSTRPDLAQPAISWNPVIAPGDFIFYSGKMWPEWKGQALIAGMGYPGLVRVKIDGDKGREEARYPLGHRIREIREAPDGSLLLLEDGKGGRLLRLTRK
ncbi:MAG: PQQ-dependent sugar dehydrogenase [Pseudomonadota bacterium]|nr:PQQ-dependent sugar dehydrogenase [Pseudomonadota bacterium]